MTARDRRPLAERWRPSRLSELVGNRRAREEVAAWADGWSGPGTPARRALVLVGPPGVGKTSAATALASERGWALVEMNASDTRSESAVERVAGRASLTHTLDDERPTGGPRRTLILLDEADCLTAGRTSEGPRSAPAPPPLRSFLEGRYGTIGALNAAWGLVPGGKPKPFADWAALPRSPGNAAWAKGPAARRDLEDWRDSGRAPESGDRGGLAAIARLVRSTRQPIVLTVNDARPLGRYGAVFRSVARTVEFGPIDRREIAARLSEIAREERLAVAPADLDRIVDRAQGDLRAALNDLESVALVPATAGGHELYGARDRPSDFAAFTEELLSVPRLYRSVEIRDRLDAPPDDLLPWVEENVPWFAPDARHRSAALETVAAAERLLSRARRWRVFGLWSYAGEILTGGVSVTIRERPLIGGGHAQFPRFLGAMGASRSSRAVRDTLAQKLGGRLHMSRRKARELALPLVEGLLTAPAGSREPGARAGRALALELDLSPEEVAAALGTDPADPAVVALFPVAEASPPPVERPEGERPGASTEPKERPKPPGRRQRRLGEFSDA